MPTDSLTPEQEAATLLCSSAPVEQRIAHALRLIRVARAGEQMFRAANDYIDWHGPTHTKGCPGDDTCNCAGKPISEAISAAYRACCEAGMKHTALADYRAAKGGE